MNNTKLNLIRGNLVSYKGERYILCQDIWYANDKYFAYIWSPEKGKSLTVSAEEIIPETVEVGDEEHSEEMICTMDLNCRCEDCKKENDFMNLWGDRL